MRRSGVRASTPPHIAIPCSERIFQSATGAVSSGLRLFASNSGCQTQIYWRFAVERDRQPPREVRRISRRSRRAGRPLELRYNNTRPRENGSRCCFAKLTKKKRAGALQATRARSVATGIPARVRPAEHDPTVAISEPHPLIHEKMTLIHKQPPSSTIQLCSSISLGGEACRQACDVVRSRAG